MFFAFLLIGGIAYHIAYWITLTGIAYWRSFVAFVLAFISAWLGGGYLVSVLLFPSGGEGHSMSQLVAKGMLWALFFAGYGVYRGRFLLRTGSAAPALKFPKLATKILGGVAVAGIAVAVALPAYQDYMKRQISAASNSLEDAIFAPAGLKPFDGLMDGESRGAIAEIGNQIKAPPVAAAAATPATAPAHQTAPSPDPRVAHYADLEAQLRNNRIAFIIRGEAGGAQVHYKNGDVGNIGAGNPIPDDVTQYYVLTAAMDGRLVYTGTPTNQPGQASQTIALGAQAAQLPQAATTTQPDFEKTRPVSVINGMHQYQEVPNATGGYTALPKATYQAGRAADNVPQARDNFTAAKAEGSLDRQNPSRMARAVYVTQTLIEKQLREDQEYLRS